MLSWDQSPADLAMANAPLLADQITRLHEVSAFYRAKWAGHPLEFQALPLITKQDLHEALQGDELLGSNRCVPPEEVSHIHTSSGTSGKPTYFGLTAADYVAWMRIFRRGFAIAGVRRDDRVLHAFAMARGYAGGVPMIDALYDMGCAALPIGAEAGSARLIDALDRLRPRVLYASPSMARHLADRYAQTLAQPASQSSIELLITGGEPGAGDPVSKALLSRTWGAEVREMGGGTDVCPMMFVECGESQGLHFIAGDEVAAEVIDPDSGAVLDVSAPVEGEIVYSHLRRSANPVMRMRHGDVVSLNPQPCACGVRTARIRFEGRSDDMIIVRGVKVFPSSVQVIVSEFAPTLTGRFVIDRPADRVADGELRVVCEAEPEATAVAWAFERRARELLGVRVTCTLVAPRTLSAEGEQKGRWIRNV